MLEWLKRHAWKACSKSREQNRKLGKVLEWLKRQTWKVCNGRKPFAGSNPALSAENTLIISD